MNLCSALFHLAQKSAVQVPDRKNLHSRLDSQFLGPCFWMKNFLPPLFRNGPDFKHVHAVFCLDAQLPVRSGYPAHLIKRNLHTAFGAAKNQLAGLEQRLSFLALPIHSHHALRLVAHRSPHLLPVPFTTFSAARAGTENLQPQTANCINPMSQSTATPPARTDWSLIWAQPGFRYFFFAMFISLFGSGMNFAGVSWHILALTHSTVKVSYQVIVATAPGLLIPFIGGVLIDRYDRRYLGIALDFSRGMAVLATAYIAWRGHLELSHLYLITLIVGAGSAMYWADVNALVQEVMPASQFTGANAA